MIVGESYVVLIDLQVSHARQFSVYIFTSSVVTVTATGTATAAFICHRTSTATKKRSVLITVLLGNVSPLF